MWLALAAYRIARKTLFAHDRRPVPSTEPARPSLPHLRRSASRAMSRALVIDAHLHCTGQENADDVLRALDEAGIDLAVLLEPFLSEGYSMHDAESLRQGNAYLA